MTGFSLTRRAFCASSLALLSARGAFAQGDMVTLVAQETSHQIAPPEYPATNVWSYDGGLPGPTIRLPQGARLQRRLVNDLPVPTSIHWHGIRIDNAMDGVAGLTQDAVPPGESFDYDFRVPDAGTYWYHAHTMSMEQVGRGLAGPLIVEEQTPPDVDQDLVLMLSDWLLDPADAQFYEPFDDAMSLSHGGRMGNLLGTNGSYAYEAPVAPGSRLRLRLINGANARIFVLALEGLSGWTVAHDGMPLEDPEPVSGELILAPAQRIDLIVDVTAGAGETAALLRLDDDDQWRPQVLFPTEGPLVAKRPAAEPLPPNPRMDLPDLGAAQSHVMRLEGGMMGRMDRATYQGESLGFRELMSRGQFWSLSGQAGQSDTPFADLKLGDVLRVSFDNQTAFPHAMHLHGMHFRELRPDGSFGPMRDTILSIPGEPLEIAFTADNPGKWLFHCHMLGHAASGMTTWINVT